MKYQPHSSVLFCTFSIEEGLLLLAHRLCQAMIKSFLARAKELYPVRVSHILVESTHIHPVLVVTNADRVDAFFSYYQLRFSLVPGSLDAWLESEPFRRVARSLAPVDDQSLIRNGYARHLS